MYLTQFLRDTSFSLLIALSSVSTAFSSEREEEFDDDFSTITYQCEGQIVVEKCDLWQGQNNAAPPVKKGRFTVIPQKIASTSGSSPMSSVLLQPLPRSKTFQGLLPFFHDSDSLGAQGDGHKYEHNYGVYRCQPLPSVPSNEGLFLLDSGSEEEEKQGIPPLYDFFEASIRSDLGRLRLNRFAIAPPIVVNIEHCKLSSTRALVESWGFMGKMKVALYYGGRIPSSFDRRLKTLAILLDDLYEWNGFRELPARLMDLLQGESLLTRGKIKAAHTLLMLPAQYMTVERDKAWRNFQQNRAYAFEGMLKRYVSSSQDVIFHIALYENIFFYRDLQAHMPDSVKGRLMALAGQDRAIEILPTAAAL
tara:strand:+ start:196 stop:1287 length:1092 start_codon:yes stop_codon:yes gene_type:complete